MILRFSRKVDDPALAEARQRLRDWARDALGVDDRVSFTVSEIACGDAACGGIETIVLIMAEGRPTQALKIPGAMRTIGWPQVLDAVSRRPDLWPP